jgi:hypothetical protein
LPADFSIDEETALLLIAELEQGSKTEFFYSHYSTFNAFKNDVDTSFTANFDFDQIDNSKSSSSLLDELEGGEEKLDEYEIFETEVNVRNEFDDLELDELPTDAQLEPDDVIDVDYSEKVHNEPPVNAASGAVDSIVDQDPVYKEREPAPQMVQTSQTMGALKSMISSLAVAGAEIGKGLEGVTAPIASWGIKKISEYSNKLETRNGLVSNVIDRISDLAPDKAQEHVREMRDSNLASNMDSIADVMEQVRDSMAEMTQPVGNSNMSIVEMQEEVKKADNPKMSAFLENQIIDSLREKGVESLIDTAISIGNGNQLISNYLEQAEKAAERLGENIDEAVSDTLTAYSEELKESESLLSSLASLCEKEDLFDANKSEQLREAMEKLRESVSRFMSNLAGKFTKASAGVQGPLM